MHEAPHSSARRSHNFGVAGFLAAASCVSEHGKRGCNERSHYLEGCGLTSGLRKLLLRRQTNRRERGVPQRTHHVCSAYVCSAYAKQDGDVRQLKKKYKKKLKERCRKFEGVLGEQQRRGRPRESWWRADQDGEESVAQQAAPCERTNASPHVVFPFDALSRMLCCGSSKGLERRRQLHTHARCIWQYAAGTDS